MKVEGGEGKELSAFKPRGRTAYGRGEKGMYLARVKRRVYTCQESEEGKNPFEIRTRWLQNVVRISYGIRERKKDVQKGELDKNIY